MRFTICHEFAHIFRLHFKNKPCTQDQYEKEANMFAARILMPLCVLKEIRAFTPEKIKEVCKTSITASTYRAQRLEQKMKLNYFYKSKLERKVKTQFDEFIKDYLKRNKL